MLNVKPVLLSLSLVFISINLGAVTPENSHDYIDSLIEYHDSGQYLYELTMVVEEAEKICESRLSKSTVDQKSLRLCLMSMKPWCRIMTILIST